jgi:hypothetical protein
VDVKRGNTSINHTVVFLFEELSLKHLGKLHEVQIFFPCYCDVKYRVSYNGDKRGGLDAAKYLVWAVAVVCTIRLYMSMHEVSTTI